MVDTKYYTIYIFNFNFLKYCFYLKQLFVNSDFQNFKTQVEDHINLNEKLPSKEINCSAYKQLSFSVHAYDHLKAVQKRYLLESQPLKRLETKMNFLKNPTRAATAIHHALEKVVLWFELFFKLSDFLFR